MQGFLGGRVRRRNSAARRTLKRSRTLQRYRTAGTFKKKTKNKSLQFFFFEEEKKTKKVFLVLMNIRTEQGKRRSA
jgi:hypothetical protein